MNYKYLHIFLFGCLLLLTNACQKEMNASLIDSNETGSIILNICMTPTSSSRNGNAGITQLNYVVKDGEIIPCEVSQFEPTSRAGEGNTADGDGMADLTVFLVNANDDIVAKQSFTNLENVTTQSLNFLNLEKGEYIVYAYANTIGNDWFTLPSESDTSFAKYKDAFLKGLKGSTPTIQNNRMPLTGKLSIPVEGGNISRTINMLRPVGKLSVTLKNEKSVNPVTTKEVVFLKILPHTAYVFQHNSILPQSEIDNAYYSFASEGEYTIFPGSSHLFYDSLLYETFPSEGFNYSISYKAYADYVFQEMAEGKLNGIDKTDDLYIKIEGHDLFLKLEQKEDNTYQLKAVPSIYKLDDQCIWQLTGNGNNNRGLKNKSFSVYLSSNNNKVSFTGNDKALKFLREGNSSIIQLGSGKELTYNFDTKEFSATNQGTYLQFFKHKDISGDQNPSYKHVESKVNELTSIHRNQHIRLNIIFRD